MITRYNIEQLKNGVVNIPTSVIPIEGNTLTFNNLNVELLTSDSDTTVINLTASELLLDDISFRGIDIMYTYDYMYGRVVSADTDIDRTTLGTCTFDSIVNRVTKTRSGGYSDTINTFLHMLPDTIGAVLTSELRTLYNRINKN